MSPPPLVRTMLMCKFVATTATTHWWSYSQTITFHSMTHRWSYSQTITFHSFPITRRIGSKLGVVSSIVILFLLVIISIRFICIFLHGVGVVWCCIILVNNHSNWRKATRTCDPRWSQRCLSNLVPQSHDWEYSHEWIKWPWLSVGFKYVWHLDGGGEYGLSG